MMGAGRNLLGAGKKRPKIKGKFFLHISISSSTLSSFKIFKITIYFIFKNLKFKKYNSKSKFCFRKENSKCKKYISKKKIHNTKI